MKSQRPSASLKSLQMSRIRQKGTGAEIATAAALRKLGAAYRLNVRKLPGSPDFANRTRKWAVFVHGCFWHHHANCKRATVPKSNRKFWLAKFAANRRRDALSVRRLKRAGYCVAVVWECEVANETIVATRLSQVLEASRVNMSKTINH